MDARTLVGERVLLRDVAPSDARARQRLGWHRSIERNYAHQRETRPMSEQEAHDWLDRVERRDRLTSWVMETSGQLTGEAFLHSRNDADRKARRLR
jgi:hypothetical protein